MAQKIAEHVTLVIALLVCSGIDSGVFRGGHGAMPPFGPTMKIFYRRLYMKRCVFCHFPTRIAKFNNV